MTAADQCMGAMTVADQRRSTAYAPMHTYAHAHGCAMTHRAWNSPWAKLLHVLYENGHSTQAKWQGQYTCGSSSSSSTV